MTKHVLELSFKCRNCGVTFSRDTSSDLGVGSYMAHAAMKLPIEYTAQISSSPMPVFALTHYPHDCNKLGVVGMGDIVRAIEKHE